MKQTHKETKEAAAKAAGNADYRLSSFFELENMSKTGPIYEELNSSAKYCDQKEIARGGMKTIYSVYDRHADRVLAMAQLHENTSEEMFEPFLREAQLTARLDHPNIIKVHDISLNEEKKPFFTMDLKTGQNLGQILAERRLMLPELLVIFIKICDAVSYAHSQGVIHLDIKPDNIQIGEYGEVIVCDWGLGKIINDSTFSDDHISSSDLLNDMTLHGKIKGTPGYMAPEQTGLTNFNKGISTDTYSLGAILYKVLCGKTPFEGDIESVLKKTAIGDFLAPSTITKVPERLEGICLKAMEHAPQDRYQSVNDFKKDISAYRNGYMTSAEEFTLLKAVKLFFNRNKIISLTLLTTLLTIIIITYLFINNLQQAKNAALRFKQNAEIARNAALESEQRAIGLAEKYQVEKEESERRGKSSAPMFTSKCINLWRLNKPQQALMHVESALQLAPNSRKAIELKSRLLCSLFNFSGVITFLKTKGYSKLSADDKSMIAVCLRLSQKYKGLNKPVSDEVKLKIISEVINSLNLRSENLADDFVYTLMTDDLSLAKRIEYSKALIKIFNPNLSNFTFKFNRETDSLDISNNPGLAWAKCLSNFPAKRLNISRSGLKDCLSFKDMPLIELNAEKSALKEFRIAYGTKVKILNLSHTVINNLSSLANGLEILDISHTSINSLNKLSSIRGLRELTVNKGQFTNKQINSLSRKIKINIKD